MAATIERKNSKRKTLILDESPGVRYTVGLVLGERYEVLGSGELGEGLGLVERGGVEVAILGLDYPFSYYHPFLQSLRRIQSRLPILFLVSQKGEEKSFPLSDTLGKPFFAEELREKVASLVLRGEREGRVWSFSGLFPLEEKVRRWIDSSRISVEVRERVLRLSSLPLSVLIEGEEGTGKSWVARGLHCLGSWREREFVRISCKGLTRGEFLEELRGRDGDDPPEKNGVEGASAADGGHRRPQLADLPQLQQVRAQENTQRAGNVSAGGPEPRRA